MKTITAVGILVLVCSVVAFGQFPEDALRFSTPGLGMGARALGLGTAYTGLASDYTAVYWNPAGLGQIRSNEISVGLSHLSFGDQGTLGANSQSFTNSATSLNSLGMVYPFPTSRGSLVFAIGYGRQNDYTTGLSFRGVNPRSSIIQYWAPDGSAYPRDLSANLAYQLYLANIDTVNGIWDSKIFGNVEQAGKVLEGGGLNHVSLAAAIEAARNLYLGISLNFITGSYTYSRTYTETDVRNLYTAIPFDFDALQVSENIESDIGGFMAKMGLLYRPTPQTRFGFTVRTPSYMTIRETYSQRGTSTFDNGDSFEMITADGVKNEYDVVSPFVFGVGISHMVEDLILSADAEYADWTQMEFRNADQRLLNYNLDMKEIFRPTLNLKAGVEIFLRNPGMRLRGGFAYLPSPFEGDPAALARKYVTGGIGFVIENSVAVDIGYGYGFWDSFRYNYDATSRTEEKITTHNLIATVGYRF